MDFQDTQTSQLLTGSFRKRKRCHCNEEFEKRVDGMHLRFSGEQTKVHEGPLGQALRML